MGAIISTCGLYRYVLTRGADLFNTQRMPALFVMLNPSTADATIDDPTIRRCMGFSKKWDCAGLTVVNLYALRATKPKELWEAKDPVGPDNETNLRLQLIIHGDAVCAWGNNAKQWRVNEFLKLASELETRLWCFGLTKAGQPKHPLYMKLNQPLIRYKEIPND